MNLHQPIGVCVIVLDKTKKKVLLGKRKNAYGEGMWGLPGGRMELKEKLEDAAKRELLEETNLIAKKIIFIGVVRELQETYNFIHFGFLCEKYEGKLINKEPDKLEEWLWFDLIDLPKDILPGHNAILDIYINKNINLKDLC